MADQADGAGHDAEAAYRTPVQAQLAGEGADGTGGVQDETPFLGDLFHPLAVLPVETGLSRDLEKPDGPGIDRLVDRMPQAGDSLQRLRVRVLRKHFRDVLGRADEDASKTAKAGGNRSLESFRCAEIGET